MDLPREVTGVPHDHPDQLASYDRTVKISPDEARARIAVLRRQASTERDLASRAASRAAMHETPIQAGGPEEVHAASAAAHRRAEAIHRTAARIAERHRGDLEQWLSQHAPQARRPRLIDATAEVLGIPGLSAMMRFGAGGQWSRLSATTATAQAAAEAEALTGQGPATDAWLTGTPITAAGTEIAGRWPLYADATGQLDLPAVAAAPLGDPGGHLGAICACLPAAAVTAADQARVSEAAAALTRLLLHQAGNIGQILARDTSLTVIHQATGYITAHTGCTPPEAHSLLQAIAFADAIPLAQAAAAILSGDAPIRPPGILGSQPAPDPRCRGPRKPAAEPGRS